jgi:very-short-patch-repair endonuclease
MRRKIIPYRKDLKTLARNLRKKMTLSEVLLWDALKGKKLSGYDFDRQKPVGNYIADFYCKELKLIIEIDGASHIGDEKYSKDTKRQNELEEMGIRFLRYSEKDLRDNLNSVVAGIENWIKNNS